MNPLRGQKKPMNKVLKIWRYITIEVIVSLLTESIFMLRCTKNDIPSFRLKPKGLFDIFFGKNRKNELPKDYVNHLNG